MGLSFFTKLGLLERVGEPLPIRDIERVADPPVVRAKAHESSHDRLIGAVAFAGAGEGSMQLDQRPFRRPAHESPSEQSQPTRPRGVRGRWADHDGTDDVEEAYHSGLGTGDWGLGRCVAEEREWEMGNREWNLRRTAIPR